MLPLLTYLAAFGIVESVKSLKRSSSYVYGLILGVVALYSTYYFFFGYFHVYPAFSARSYEYGFKELSDFQVENNNANMLVIWNGYYHNNDFRFWQATPYPEHINFKQQKFVVGDSHFYQTFSNLYFVNPKSVDDLKLFLADTKIDFVILPDRYFVAYPTDLDNIYGTPSAVIKYPDSTPALKIYKTK
jgi:hypothetical protein